MSFFKIEWENFRLPLRGLARKKIVYKFITTLFLFPELVPATFYFFLFSYIIMTTPTNQLIEREKEYSFSSAEE